MVKADTSLVLAFVTYTNRPVESTATLLGAVPAATAVPAVNAPVV
jgi:hypothetical protein